MPAPMQPRPGSGNWSRAGRADHSGIEATGAGGGASAKARHLELRRVAPTPTGALPHGHPDCGTASSGNRLQTPSRGLASWPVTGADPGSNPGPAPPPPRPGNAFPPLLREPREISRRSGKPCRMERASHNRWPMARRPGMWRCRPWQPESPWTGLLPLSASVP